MLLLFLIFSDSKRCAKLLNDYILAEKMAYGTLLGCKFTVFFAKMTYLCRKILKYDKRNVQNSLYGHS